MLRVMPTRHLFHRATRRVAAALALAGALSGALAVGGASPAAAATVTVQRGQTLSQLAAQLHTTVAALAAANGITNPDRVLAGAVLQVPGAPVTPNSVMVVVGRGD